VDLGAMGPFNPEYSTGCACLTKLLDPNGRTVTIQLLDGPGSPVPNSGGTKIGSAKGGATTVTKPADEGNQEEQADGSAGKGRDGKPGADMTTYLDRSNNAQTDGTTGYPDPANPGQPAPLWLILAHELTTGHAYHGVQGRIFRTMEGAENQAILSEN